MPPRKGPGRYPAIVADAKTMQTLTGLGNILATTKETAAVLGVHETTLFDFFAREPQAKEAFDRAKEQGKASLRRTQLRLAEKFPAMAIFLGKNYLGQSDKQEVEHSGPQGGPIETDGILRIEFVRPSGDDGSAT